MSTTSPLAVNRRTLLKGAAGALAVFAVDASSLTRANLAEATPLWVNGWVQINDNNTATIAFCAGELGQGIMTGLAQWAAEELKIDWSQVRTELVPPGRALAVADNADIGYGTGGSKGMMNRFGLMRKAGMEVRLKLEAASGGVAVGGGMLRMPDNSLQPYSAWKDLAATQTVTMPTAFDPPYVQSADFKLVGKDIDVVRRVDIESKTNGSAKFGLDVRLPGMVFAVVKNCPTWTGTLDPLKVPAAPAGTSIVPLKPWVAVDTRWTSTDTVLSPSYGTPMNLGSAYNAVAVIASNTWIAKQAASALSVSWTIPTSASKLTSSTILSEAKTLITSTALTTVGTATTPPQLLTAEKTGDVTTALASAPVKVDQYYQLPAIPHVMMEVPSATVRINNDGTVECWVSTQSPVSARTTIAKVLGIPVANVTVYPQLCGGGFGRRIDTDYIAQAAQVAKTRVGTPVMLVWPREEDLGHDQPRPAVYARARLGYDTVTEKLTAFNVRNVSQSPSYQRNPFRSTNGIRTPSADNVEGAKNSPYKRVVANVLVDHVLQNSEPMTSVPTGYWRSVGASTMCFVVESAMDELAISMAKDPFAFRRSLIAQGAAADDVRMLKVMDAAKTRIESVPLPAGSARGYAISEAFGSKAAVAVEVTKWATDLTLRVTRVAVAVDPGYAVNPNQIKAQMEGGILHGISSAMWGQLAWSSGKASSRNFSNTRVLRMRETPTIQIDLLPSGNLSQIGGTGEVPVPMMAPAMANAWFQLTGTRVRTMPFYPGATMSG